MRKQDGVMEWWGDEDFRLKIAELGRHRAWSMGHRVKGTFRIWNCELRIEERRKAQGARQRSQKSGVGIQNPLGKEHREIQLAADSLQPRDKLGTGRQQEKSSKGKS